MRASETFHHKHKQLYTCSTICLSGCYSVRFCLLQRLYSGPLLSSKWGHIGYCFISFYGREGCALGEQSNANKFTLNKNVISLLILSPNFLAAAKIVLDA